MKPFLFSCFALALISGLWFLANPKPAIKDVVMTDKPAEAAPFVVAELFTSEGCSSCPAADALTSELYEAYHAKGLPVYFLAFHVGYWDYIGWKDDFAKEEFTERQYAYGRKFDLQSVYTPQLIVNGSDEFVGSNQNHALAAIETGLKNRASVEITASASVMRDKIRIEYRLSEIPEGCLVNFAVIESGLERQIRRGENSGRTLRHENVVRSFLTVVPKALSGSAELLIPDDLKISNASVVIYAQNDQYLNILGAKSVNITTK